MDHIPEISL